MQDKPTSTSANPAGKYPNDAALWQARYTIAKTNQRSMFKRFADWYDDFYAIVQAKNYSLWRSKIYIPILATKVWNLVAKFISLKPGFEVRPRMDGITSYNLDDNEDLESAAYFAQLKLEYDYDNPNLDKPIREKMLSTLIDTAVTGTGLAKVAWTTKKVTKYSPVVRSDGTIDRTKEKVTESVIGYNDLIPVNIFNVFVAPTSVDLYSSPWLIIKDFKTLEQLKDVNAGKGVEIYKNLDQLSRARAVSDEFAVYKKSRNRLTVAQDPIIEDKTVDFFPVYECYDNSTKSIITYAEAASGEKGQATNWVEIRRDKNVYWHGKYPLVRFTIKQRPFDFWGQGVMETSQKLQRAANDVFNHYMDNWNLSVDGMLMANESANVNDYIVEPGGLITYRTEEPKQFKFPEPNPASLNMIMSQIMQGIEADTISNYSTGNPSSDIDKTRGTKGGVLAIQEAADDLVAFMRMNFQESIKTIGQMWESNNRQFMSKPMTVAITHGKIRGNVTIKPADLQGEFDLRVDEASMMPISDDQAKQQYAAFTQGLLEYQQASFAQHQAFGTDPLVLNFADMAEELAEKNGFRNVKKFIGTAPDGPSGLQLQAHAQAQQAQAQAQQQQVQAQQQAAQLKQQQTQAALQLEQQQHQQKMEMLSNHPTTKMIENINYKDAPPDIQRQIEAAAGYVPSHMEAPAAAHVKKGNQTALELATALHAQGAIHPSVLDAVRGHMGMSPVANPNTVVNPAPVQAEQPQGA